MKRRRFMKGVGPIAALTLAGCTGSDEGNGGGGGDGGSNQEFDGGSNDGSDAPPDSDNDGVPDSDDDFPNNAQYSSDSDGDRVPDKEDDYPNNSQYSVLEEDWIDQLVQIREDQYRTWSFDFDSQTRLDYDFVVRDGPRIDVFTVTQSEFAHYENQERFRYLSDLTFQDTAGESGTAVLSSGSYVLVLDNTNMGGAKPPSNFDEDISKVEITIDASA